jgi:hypothetical protein
MSLLIPNLVSLVVMIRYFAPYPSCLLCPRIIFLRGGRTFLCALQPWFYIWQKIFLFPLPKNKGSTHNTKKSWNWYLILGAQFVPNLITLIQKKILKSSLLKIKKLPYISIVDFIIEKQLLLQINKYTNVSHTFLPFLTTQLINPFHNSGISPN